MKAADGTGETRSLVEGAGPSFSPDGRFLLYVEFGENFDPDLWFLPQEDGGEATPFLVTPAGESSPQMSPDGRFVAYTSDESGRREVYIKPFPRGAGKWQISRDGGSSPRWSTGGGRLFFTAGDRLMEVRVTMRPSVSLGAPRELFTSERSAGYDVGDDGERFVTLRMVGPETRQPGLRVVQNWPAEFASH